MLLLDAGIGASRGDAVLALLERAQVPPEPPFYKLCYDYLAGVRTLDTIRANAILEADAVEGARSAGEQLYEDFVAPYRTEESVAQVVARMVERIALLETLVVASQEATRSQAVELAGATEELAADDLDGTLLRDWISRLEATNATLRDANAALSAELEQTREVFVTGQDELAALSRSTTIDPLTGIANRAGVDQALVRVFEEAASGRDRLALAVVDVDHFKQLNDTYGHQIGDAVLRLVSKALMTSTREHDVIGRMGGDEFVAVVRDEDMTGARLIAERIRRAVVDCDLTKVLGKGVLGNVTASIGVAQYRAGDDLSTLFDRADRCLFDAKQRGRNQTVMEQPSGKLPA
ncbi:MAG: GGDEF domain-containing protein [Hyphomicrobiales bacterium]|nr:MAG: GGDEF domain-containing protein [Hyphomicrobiales bacterium]